MEKNKKLPQSLRLEEALRHNSEGHILLPYPQLYGQIKIQPGLINVQKNVLENGEESLFVLIDRESFMRHTALMATGEPKRSIGILLHALLEDGTILKSLPPVNTVPRRFGYFFGSLFVRKEDKNGKEEIIKKVSYGRHKSCEVHLHDNSYSPEWEIASGLRVARNLEDMSKIHSIKIVGSVRNIRDVEEDGRTRYYPKSVRVHLFINYKFVDDEGKTFSQKKREKKRQDSFSLPSSKVGKKREVLPFPQPPPLTTIVPSSSSSSSSSSSKKKKKEKKTALLAPITTVPSFSSSSKKKKKEKKTALLSPTTTVPSSSSSSSPSKRKKKTRKQKNPSVGNGTVTLCSERRQRWGPICYSTQSLRKMLKKIRHLESKSGRGEETLEYRFRPYTKYGGRRGKNNHSKRIGLFKTIKEEIGSDIQPHQWPFLSDSENPVLKSIHQDRELVNLMLSEYLPLTPMPCGWLSSDNIHKVLKIFSRIKKFKFKDLTVTGPDMDLGMFRNYVQRILQENFRRTPSSRKGMAYLKHLNFGTVFNTSRGGGSHWVAVFFKRNLPNNSAVPPPPHRRERKKKKTRQEVLEYFDSFGNSVASAIEPFIKVLLDSLIEVSGNSWVLKESKKKHQHGAVECGMYSLYYILQRLKGNTMEKINSRRRISDSEMRRFRELVFTKLPERMVRNLEEKQRKRIKETKIKTGQGEFMGEKKEMIILDD